MPVINYVIRVGRESADYVIRADVINVGMILVTCRYEIRYLIRAGESSRRKFLQNLKVLRQNVPNGNLQMCKTCSYS